MITKQKTPSRATKIFYIAGFVSAIGLAVMILAGW